MLKRAAWDFHLADYPDRHFVRSLLHIIDFGCSIGFSGEEKLQISPNLKSARDFPDSITTDLNILVSENRVAGPFTLPPHPFFRVCPLGSVARKRAPNGKRRVINHLSYPEGDSINNGIPPSEAAIVYDRFEKAVEDVVKSGRGSLLAKLDLKDAFRHIPIRQADWHYMGYRWLEQFWNAIVLVFGIRSAPYIFNLFAEALHWIIDRHIPAHIRHYLDDFLTIFCPTTPLTTARNAVEWIMGLGSELGLQFQPAKTIWPTTCIDFLGLELDSEAMEARLPPDKLEYLHGALVTWRQKRFCQLLELQELIGFLQFASQVIPRSRSFIRRLIRFSTSFPHQFSIRRIPNSAKADVAWWSAFASHWNGVRLLNASRPIVVVHTDASGVKGIGGHLGKEWFATRVPRRYREKDIQVKEFYAILHAVLCWGGAWKGSHVVFHCDNQAVVDVLNTGTNRSDGTMHLMRTLQLLAAALDFSFTSFWISSEDNAVADAASRFMYTQLFKFAPHLNKTPTSTNPQITSMKRTVVTPAAWPSIFGTASPAAHAAPTPLGRNNSSSSSSSVPISKTKRADGCLQHQKRSLSGSRIWETGSSRRARSRHTSPLSGQCTLTTALLSKPARVSSSPASFVASNASTEHRLTASSPSRSKSCSPSPAFPIPSPVLQQPTSTRLSS